jgi:TRAP-type C4-dicarboxylate transport system substrate-binding protein
MVFSVRPADLVLGGVMRLTWTPKSLAVAVTISLAAAACTSGPATDAAGEAAAPTNLRLATEDDPGRPAAHHIFEFAEQVQALSGGELIIEPVWDANGDEADDWDQVVARKVVRAEMEMGMVPARAWDTEGVASLRALHAPFLVTSEQAMADIATGELAGEMLAGLDTVGVTGLALVPEALRHLVLFQDATLSAATLAGKAVRAPRSETTYALFEALGAKPDDFTQHEQALDEGIQSGTVVAAESSFALALTLPSPAAVVGNVPLFPKMNSLVINSEVFESLSDQQQDVLRTAARRTVDWAVDNNPSDAMAVGELCHHAVPIVSAGRDVVDQLERSAQAVYRELEQDQTTKEMIARLRSLRQDTEVGGTTISSCG